MKGHRLAGTPPVAGKRRKKSIAGTGVNDIGP